ncbi:hypothetical protein BKA67DRAFT_310489 [Truncatella angustata]|uniref:Prokaryotic-type class I peptide chain release factors domain-containing protein n=1 Tax=Truncatella angustata TaxID=152316 RepID=A0A9P8UJ79_9PEZI|nr:uncharacterized protein BKA67DRAFT_310489 [Truncatella angustata]KAH6653171.1 hypothetical protein BKA67DRAFT_310489 [Truncatella angustata]
MFRCVVSSFSKSQTPSLVGRPLVHVGSIRNQAFDAAFDQDDLAEARKWHTSFDEHDLPKGQTSFSRSSGPGGQHVNKTETKATTVWPVFELTRMLPKLMHSPLRSSRYYTSRTDSLTIQAQTQRSRSANTDENFDKLVEEIRRIYREAVPGVTNTKKAKKYEALEKAFHENRVTSKKQQSAKKASRKGSLD